MSRRRTILVAIAVILLAAIVPPLINVPWFHSSIDKRISRALGRQVGVGDISLRLLPQPGFDLKNFVLADDPAFSAEPMLHAGDVTAYLRLSSLWRGRLEIARLSFKDPSLNLVRREDGRWNAYALLERASQIPSAPTGQLKPEWRPRFPYIEASSGRINFKIGQEKKVYALTDADFALWLASENKWSMRLAARPVRTDANLSDTGTLKLSGSFQRASTLRDTPVKMTLRLDHAQLGQLTNLIYGRDRGWRGTVNVAAQLSGTPAALQVHSEAEVQDFHRYDIIVPGAVRLAMRCDARFSSVDQSWSDANCEAPVGNGLIAITGNVASAAFHVNLAAHNVPMNAVLALARHAKRDLPLDLAAAGSVNATLAVERTAGSGSYAHWTGGGETADFRLRSQLSGREVELGTIPFSVRQDPENRTASRVSADRSNQLAVPTAVRMGIAVGPFLLDPAADESAVVSGWLSQKGYSLTLTGNAQLEHLLQVARTLGVHTIESPVRGGTNVDLVLAGEWAGFPAPEITGRAQLHNVFAAMEGVATPVEIASANVLLGEEQLSLRNIVATAAGTGMHLFGSIDVPRRCAEGERCPAQVDLHADNVTVTTLNELLNPYGRKRPWYQRVFGGGPSVLTRLNATGKISATRVVAGPVVAIRCSAKLRLDRGKLRLSNLQGQLWGGKQDGEVQADFSRPQPAYSFSGTLDRISLAEVTNSSTAEQVPGTVSLVYRGAALGWNAQELLATLTSTADFDLQDGLLRHITLGNGAGPLRVRRFTGRFSLRDGQFTLLTGKLQAPSGIYQVSGTALIDKQLNLRLVRDSSHAFAITGTLGAPKVVAMSRPDTEAALTK